VPVSPTDAELVQQALAGSQAAYRDLVSRYATPAVNFATRMVRDRALAEDLAQEAFARAFERLATYDQQRRFVSWFFQILHNVTIDYLRRKHPPTISLDDLEETGALPPRRCFHRSLARSSGRTGRAGSCIRRRARPHPPRIPRSGRPVLSRRTLGRRSCGNHVPAFRHGEDLSVPCAQRTRADSFGSGLVQNLREQCLKPIEEKLRNRR